MVEGTVSMYLEKAHPGVQEAATTLPGFANFYRHFIKNVSSISTPLHTLTSPQCRFTWSRGAEEAFSTLKDRFTSTTMPDPKLQFMDGWMYLLWAAQRLSV